MHPFVMASRDPDESTAVARLRFKNGGQSDTFHILNKNNHIPCGSHQGEINADDDIVVEHTTIRFEDALERDDVCRRCTGQAYMARNG